MVKKRGAFERIEKVVKTKRPAASLTSPSSSPKRVRLCEDKNMLSDNLLNLYKNEIPSKSESSANGELLNCVEIQTNKNMANEIPSSRKSVSDIVLRNCAAEKKEQVQTTQKSKSTKGEAGSGKKKSSVLAFKHSELTFKDVGGLDEILEDILEIFLHIKDPEVFKSLGIRPRGGFLLHGPPGCGKTHLVRAIAGELNKPYIEVTATELVCGISGESESKIRELFDEAVKNAPCILFIDEIDAIIPKRETSERGMERRMVTQLIKSLDELNQRDISSSVMVIGATNRPDSIDPALRRGGRFDTEFEIGIPNENARLIILKVLTKTLELSPDFDMQWLAHHTPGYVGADLESLITKAVKVCIRRIYRKYMKVYLVSHKSNLPEDVVLESIKLNPDRYLESLQAWFQFNWKIPEEELKTICFDLSDFQKALKDFVPSGKREGFVMIPDTTWDDVGALKKIKEDLQRSIIWPVKYREIFECSNMSGTKGILLYGPKGCGKTLLAKAIANECSINFISVEGPELLNMYLGESEKAVRQCFQRARDSSPCVIFFDELDAICPARSGSNANAAAERVVNQLLTEMDGMKERKEVFVIGATNRLKKIDSAMLRPGRLEKIILVDLPNAEDRFEILKCLTKNKTRPIIADDVDLKEIASDACSENFSGADLAFLLRAAFSEAMSDFVNSLETGVLRPKGAVEIKKKHFDHAFTVVKPSVSLSEKKKFQDTSLRWRQ